MKQTRKQSIRHRIVSKTDIVRLAEMISRECGDVEKEGKPTFKIECTCFDGTVYEFDSISEFEEMVDIKNMTSIEIALSCYAPYKHINLELNHGSGGSSFRIRSSDLKWADHAHKRLTDILESVSPQHSFIDSNSWVLPILLTLMFGLFLCASAVMLTSTEVNSYYQFLRNTVNSSWKKMIALTFLFFFVGLFPMAGFCSYLEKVWPSIEFNFGPEHLNKSKKRRKHLILIWTWILLPILCALLYDGLKMFMNGNDLPLLKVKNALSKETLHKVQKGAR